MVKWSKIKPVFLFLYVSVMVVHKITYIKYRNVHKHLFQMLVFILLAHVSAVIGDLAVSVKPALLSYIKLPLGSSVLLCVQCCLSPVPV